MARRTTTRPSAVSETIFEKAAPKPKIVYASSEGKEEAAALLLDGNENTYWHTPWRGSRPDYPHEVQIDLGSGRDITGFYYLPRQGSANGRVKDYEVYFSNDPKKWGKAAKKGSFSKSTARQNVKLGKTVQARYFRFVALTPLNESHPFATAAELGVIAE